LFCKFSVQVVPLEQRRAGSDNLSPEQREARAKLGAGNCALNIVDRSLRRAPNCGFIRYTYGFAHDTLLWPDRQS
jgi:hypothetical protein